MIDEILVPLDTSPLAERVLPHVRALARWTSTRPAIPFDLPGRRELTVRLGAASR